MKKDLLMISAITFVLLGVVGLAIATTTINLTGTVVTDTTLTPNPTAVIFASLKPLQSDTKPILLTPGTSPISIVGMSTGEAASSLFFDANLQYTMDGDTTFALISVVTPTANRIAFSPAVARTLNLKLTVPVGFKAVANAGGVLTLTIAETP